MDKKDESPIAIWAMIDYLDQNNPSFMSRIRKENPDIAPALSSGRTLGSNEGKVSIYSEIAKSSLEMAENKIDTTTAFLKRRMARAAHWRMFASITAAISTAGLIGALLVNARLASIITASVNVIASVVSIASQQLEVSFFGHGPNSYEIFRKLVSLASRVVGLRSELKLAEVSESSESEVLELTRRANALIAELQEVEFTVFPNKSMASTNEKR